VRKAAPNLLVEMHVINKVNSPNNDLKRLLAQAQQIKTGPNSSTKDIPVHLSHQAQIAGDKAFAQVTHHGKMVEVDMQAEDAQKRAVSVRVIAEDGSHAFAAAKSAVEVALLTGRTSNVAQILPHGNEPPGSPALESVTIGNKVNGKATTSAEVSWQGEGKRGQKELKNVTTIDTPNYKHALRDGALMQNQQIAAEMGAPLPKGGKSNPEKTSKKLAKQLEKNNENGTTARNAADLLNSIKSRQSGSNPTQLANMMQDFEKNLNLNRAKIAAEMPGRLHTGGKGNPANISKQLFNKLENQLNSAGPENKQTKKKLRDFQKASDHVTEEILANRDGTTAKV
jgi:hypothetical protein